MCPLLPHVRSVNYRYSWTCNLPSRINSSTRLHSRLPFPVTSTPLDRYSHLVDPFKRVLATHVGQSPTISRIAEESGPKMGESGSDVRIYSVTYRRDETSSTCKLVTKNATPLEQHILLRFTEQHQAVPPLDLPSPNPTERATVHMLHAESRPAIEITSDPYNPATKRVARGLAKIHADNRSDCPSWLPTAASDPMHQLWLAETQAQWEKCLADNAFATEFGRYTAPLHRALERFLDLLNALTVEQTSLTIINTDLHPDHIRLVDDNPVFIDWEQACYGSFYLDLVNYFSIESVLLYRDALDEAGYSIPTAPFIERFREVGRYMGLRYLAVGLMQWRAGIEQWKQGRWFFHYCLTLALNGR